MIKNLRKVIQNKKSASKHTANAYYFMLKESGINPSNISAKDLLKGMSNGKFPSFDSVSRMSRSIRNSKKGVQ